MNDLYPEGFVTPVESEDFEPGLTRDIVLKLSALKEEPQWLTEFRLKAFDHLQTIKRLSLKRLGIKIKNYNHQNYLILLSRSAGTARGSSR